MQAVSFPGDDEQRLNHLIHNEKMQISYHANLLETLERYKALMAEMKEKQLELDFFYTQQASRMQRYYENTPDLPPGEGPPKPPAETLEEKIKRLDPYGGHCV